MIKLYTQGALLFLEKTMKKIWLLALFGVCGLMFAGCETTQKDNEPDLENETVRILACTEKVEEYLNTEDFSTSWQPEEEWGASFILDGTVMRTKEETSSEGKVQCVVDMADKSVTVHMIEEEK